MTKLNDTQTMLLAHAAQHQDESLYPLPAALVEEGKPAARAAKAVAALLKCGFAEERETTDRAAVYRTDRDLRYGVFATAAGLAAIGVEARDGSEPVPSSPASSPKEPRPASKRNSVVALLQRDTGATLAELIAATGWLPHTTRAALTGLRKQGHTIERSKRDEETCYRIVAQ